MHPESHPCGYVGLAEAHPLLAKSRPDEETRPPAGLGPVTVYPTHSGIGLGSQWKILYFLSIGLCSAEWWYNSAPKGRSSTVGVLITRRWLRRISSFQL